MSRHVEITLASDIGDIWQLSCFRCSNLWRTNSKECRASSNSSSWLGGSCTENAEKNADFGGFSAWDSSPRSKPPPSHGPNWWDPSLSDSKGSLEPTLRQSASIHPGFRLRLHPGESVFTGRTYVFQPLKALASSELSFCRASSRDVWRIRFLLRLLPVHLPGSLLSSGWALIKLDSRFCIFRLRVLMIEISLNFIRASRTESYLKCRAFCNSKSPSCCKGRLT